MNIGQYINSEKINDTIHTLLDKVGQLNKTDVAGIAASALVAYYVTDTFLLDRLRNIPGPFASKLSRFYEVKMKSTGKEYLLVEELHNTYGDVVRKGHNTVSINDPNAIKQIYGSERFLKPPFYKAFTYDKTENMFNTLSSVSHARYRRVLAPGFSQATLDSLEDIIMDSGILALMNKFSDKYADKDVICNTFEEFHLLAFDVLGELAYGKNFNMIQLDSHPITGWLKDRSTMVPMCTTFPTLNNYPNLLSLLFPKGAQAFKLIRNFGADSLENRAAEKSAHRRDFTQIMLEAMNSDKKTNYLTHDESILSSIMLIVAGTDTTSNSMTFATYLLGKHPEVKERLFQELLQAMPDKSETLRYKDARKEHLPYLWAVIMEVTRMYPAVPGGLPRVTPKGGEIIAGKFIPGGTIVEVPTWNIHHNKAIFEEPYKFRPERWLEDGADELAKHHIVFSVGPRMCAGKNLAMMEMTLTLAHLYRRFDVTLVNPDEELLLTQQFIMKPTSQQLNVFIRNRDY